MKTILIFLSLTLSLQTAFAGNGDTGSAGGQTLSYKCDVVKKGLNGKEKIIKSQTINLINEDDQSCGGPNGRTATDWARQDVTLDLGPQEFTVKMSLGTLKDPCLGEGPGVIAKVGVGIDFNKSDTMDMMAVFRDTSAMSMQEEISGNILNFKGMNGDPMQLRCAKLK